MIRKAIIVVLTLVAVGAAVLDWRSYSNTIMREFRLTSKTVLFVHFSNGVSRLFWWSCEEDFVIEVHPSTSTSQGGMIDIRKDGDVIRPRTLSWCEYPGIVVSTAESMRRTGMSSYQFLSRTIRPYRFPPFGAGNPSLYWGLIRTPTWTVSTIFAAYPMLAFFRGPLRRWRRRRRGLCIRCGYNLEGNVSGVCPECGAEVKTK